MKLLKRLSVLALTAALTLSMAAPAMAAGSIEVTEDVSVSDDYDWTRFKGQNMTLNVYNWGEYISNGSDDSEDVVSDFEKLTGIKVNYTTFDSNESMYAKLKSGAANYDVIVPSDYMAAKMIAEGMLMPLDYDNIPNFQNIDEEYRNGDYDPENAYTVPIVGGHAGTTIIPLFSQLPGDLIEQIDVPALTKRVQFGGDEVVVAKAGMGSATLSMAYAGATFANAVLAGLKGEMNIVEQAYFQQDVLDCKFFASQIELGRNGIEKALPIPKDITMDERKAIKSAVPIIQEQIAKGTKFVDQNF